ncbi:MAG: protease complex subunit PrcB family protein [Verrucomicrobia bacterium]|nr:protease complex subunit PrcB family protein [Verrucomicrobiota bacterium]
MSALLLFASVLLFGAVGALGEEIPFRTLAQGNQSGIDVATNLVIKTRSAWEKHWKALQGKAEPRVLAPAVDFGKEMVVAVTMGRKPTGGYAIKIQRIESTPASLKILLEQRTPGPGALVTQAFTSPFHFVAVAKSALKPEFRTNAP